MTRHIVKLALDAKDFLKGLSEAMAGRAYTPVDIVRMPRRDLAHDIEIPKYATDGAAGLDLRAAIGSEIVLGPGKSAVIPTGLKIAIRDPNVVAMLYPRGGKGTREGLVLANGTGVIDSDYRGEVMIPVVNRSLTNTVSISPNERIAQMVLLPVMLAQFREVESLDETQRGEGRFSSTGKL